MSEHTRARGMELRGRHSDAAAWHCVRAGDGHSGSRIRCRFRLSFFLLSCAILLLALLPSLAAGAAPSLLSATECAPTPLPSVLRVAILVYADAPAGALSGHPFVSAGPEASVANRRFVTQSLQGLQMYTDLLAAQVADALPLPSGRNVTLQLVYVNQGRANFDNASSFPALLPSLAGPDGLWASVTNATRAQAEYGGAFTFVIASMSTPDSAQPILMNQCEDTGECIVILPFHTTPGLMTCTASEPDCVRRGRLAGTRRFSNSLAVLALSPNFATAALELLKVQGVRTVGTIGPPRSAQGATFVSQQLGRTAVLAAQLNIATVFSMEMASCGVACGATEKFVFPNRTADDVAREIAAANPEALLLWSAETPYAFAAYDEMFAAFERVDWTPRALLFMSGADSSMPKSLSDSSRIAYSIVTSGFDPRVKGPQFRNYKTASSFELLPATDLKDAPQVYAEAFNAKYAALQGEFDFSSVGAGYIPVLGFQALVIAQKLIELAETAHVPSLLLAATRISMPSVFRSVEFEISGAMRFQAPFLMQLTPKSVNATRDKPYDYAVLTPYNVGVPAVFPLPKWKERVYAPVFYSTPAEQAVVAVTAVLLLACAILLALIGVWWQHPVIAASTPLFCCLVVVGCMSMLASNFVSSLHVTNEHCRASVGLLTYGFSLTFGALFIKTYRVHTLLSSKHLAAVSLPQRDLLLAVVLILCVDMVINVPWANLVGMGAHLVVVDPIRPALNYAECRYGPQQLRFVYAHIATKCTLLLCGVVLAWKVRRAPSLFSESSHISLCIYNVSVVLAFLLPVMATGLGGRSALYLIRALSICFVAATTCIVLFAPKFWAIYLSRPRAPRAEHEMDLKSDTNRTQMSDRMPALPAQQHSSLLPDAVLTKFQQPPPSDIFSMKREGTVSPVMSGPALAEVFDDQDATQQTQQQQMHQPADANMTASGQTTRRVPHSARYALSAIATTADLNTPEHTDSVELGAMQAPPAIRHRLPAAPSAAAATGFPAVPASTTASPFTANRAIHIHVLADEDEDDDDGSAATMDPRR